MTFKEYFSEILVANTYTKDNFSNLALDLNLTSNAEEIDNSSFF
jgi:hypothetical protein